MFHFSESRGLKQVCLVQYKTCKISSEIRTNKKRKETKLTHSIENCRIKYTALHKMLVQNHLNM